MTPFDDERRQPSPHTPRCAMCDEAALPQYGGFCFRHVGATIATGAARAAVRGRRP